MKKPISKLVLLIITFFFARNVYAQEIFDAIRSGDLAKVKELVEKDPKLVKARNASQSTPLHVAVDANNEQIARYLIEKESDLNSVNIFDYTPLFYAKKVEISKLLVQSGADINYGTSYRTALGRSLAQRSREVAEYLLEKGAVLPEIGTDKSIELLRNSLKCGSLKFLDKYMKQGFDPLYESEGKSNLLHYASESNSIELIDKLISFGVSVKKANIFGLTPLHIAAMTGNLEVSKCLVRNGTEINSRTNDGKTPYNMALESPKKETANYLATLGADTRPSQFPALAGEYFGEPKPGKKAIPFTRGMDWNQYSMHGSIVVAPDGNEMLWSVQYNMVYSSKRINGQWTKPEKIMDADVPFISPDGEKLYINIAKQIEGEGKEFICVREKTDRGWSEPKELPEIVNAVHDIHWGISVDRKGNLYFGAEYGVRNRAMYAKIYCSEYIDGKYGKPQIVQGLENIPAYSPYISPDGGYLIITKAETPTSLILFRKKDRSWTEPIEFPDYIGSKGVCCTVTHDGRYLFFIGTVDGKGCPYWVDASFIKDLRKKALKDDK